MSNEHYSEEFKIDAVRQVTCQGFKVDEVAKHLKITSKHLHNWVKEYGDQGSQQQIINNLQQEIRLLNKNLCRAKEQLKESQNN